MTQLLTRSALIIGVTDYLNTLDDITPNECWGTFRETAQGVLMGFIKFAAPDPLDVQIKNLEAKLAALKAERAGK